VPRDSKEYRGPVLFNPGGPGGSGVDLIAGSRGEQFSKILGPQFDIVSFDPRGIARSTPKISFFKTRADRALWMGFTTLNESDHSVSETLAKNKVTNQLAVELDDGYLRHMNTDHTARDMLKIVEAHGRDKIQYWGFSYGSILGATFAAMFPDKVERLIIDAVADSEDYYDTLFRTNLRDTDKVLDGFFEGCSSAGSDGCPFYAPTSEDVRHNLTKISESLRERPIPVHTRKGYGVFGYTQLRSILFASLYSPYELFPLVAQGLAELAHGNATALFDLYYGMEPHYECGCDPETYWGESVAEAISGVMCTDSDPWEGTLEASRELLRTLLKSSGFGDIWSNHQLRCADWPNFPRDHLFRGPFKAKTSHPLLVIGNTADPVTSLWSAKKVSRGFEGSVLLTQNSKGHGSVSGPSLCTMKYVRDYFVNGTLPEPGTVCQVTREPFDPIDSHRGLLGGEPSQHVLSQDDQELLMAVHGLSMSPGIAKFGL
jgi:pimeloyl-ACP methyl ester carboxylesterase